MDLQVVHIPPIFLCCLLCPPQHPAQPLACSIRRAPTSWPHTQKGTWTKRGHQCQAGHKCLSISELGHSWESPLSPLFVTARVHGRRRSWPGTAEPLRFGAFNASPASYSHQGPAPCDHMSFSTFPLSGTSHVRSPPAPTIPHVHHDLALQTGGALPQSTGMPPQAPQQRDKTLFPH